jgi:hypothetical protein
MDPYDRITWADIARMEQAPPDDDEAETERNRYAETFDVEPIDHDADAPAPLSLRRYDEKSPRW